MITEDTKITKTQKPVSISHSTTRCQWHTQKEVKFSVKLFMIVLLTARCQTMKTTNVPDPPADSTYITKFYKIQKVL